MRKILLTLVSLTTLMTLSLNAQRYQPTSNFILNPDEAISFVEDVAAYTLKAKDETEGGYFTRTNDDGTPAASQIAPGRNYNYKSLCAISRSAYAFTRAFSLTGKLEYLDYANHALKYLYENGWDENNEGWHFTSDETNDVGFGPWWRPDSKWTFQQHYAIVGIAAMVEATGSHSTTNYSSATHTEWLNKSMVSLNKNVWDDDTQHYGYYEDADLNWENKREKGFTAIIDGINTHAALMALMFGNSDNILRFRELSDNALNYLVGNMDTEGVKVGFPEKFDRNWNIMQSNTNVSAGHILKTAWCLNRAAIFFDEPAYNVGAEKLLDQVLEKNNPAHDDLYDHENGGPFSSFNWSSGARLSRDKNHWMMEQAVTAGLIGYYNSEDENKAEAYLKMADETMSFFEQKMIDPITGVSFLAVDFTGNNVISSTKSDDFKAGFHDAELGYFAYLYSKIYFHNEPIVLHYAIDLGTGAEDRKLALTPLTIDSELLQIASVKLDGVAFESYDAESRELTIPSNVSGVFAVEFIPKKKEEPILASNNLIEPNVKVYPTVFDDQLTIEFPLSTAYSDVSIRLYDFSRREFLSIEKTATNMTSVLSGLSHLNQGLYVLTITTGNKTISKKVIKR